MSWFKNVLDICTGKEVTNTEEALHFLQYDHKNSKH